MKRVLAISGPPGAGKSTLAHHLSERLGAVFIEYDLYQSITAQDPAEIYRLMQTESGYDKLEIPPLEEALARLKADKAIVHPATGGRVSPADITVFETPLGRRHTATGRFIDILIWIDLPLDLALARILHCHLDNYLHSDPELLSEQVRWTHEYLQSYVQYVHEMLILQRDRVAHDADIIIDGRQDTESQLQSVLRQLDTKAGS